MSAWLYEAIVSALLLCLVLDPLRLLQIEVAVGVPEKGAKRQKARPGITYVLAGSVLIFVAAVSWVFKVGREEVRFLSAGLMVIMLIRHMLSETARNRELPAARYVAELHPQMLGTAPMLIALVFVGSWFRFTANLAGIALAGWVLSLIRQHRRRGSYVAWLAPYYNGLCWLEQFGALALSAQCLINAARRLLAP